MDLHLLDRIEVLDERIAALEAELDRLEQQRDYYRAEAGHATSFGVEMGERWAEAHWALTRLAGSQK